MGMDGGSKDSVHKDPENPRRVPLQVRDLFPGLEFVISILAAH
jgi:crotonobetainyl-CoA:carnitine CoA-transferase CaiB-like acyl-CoA transferase